VGTLPAFCALLAFLAAVGTSRAQDRTLVSEERKKAEKVFADVYGKEFERLLKSVNGADKVALVKKLSAAAGDVAKEDPELARLLREKGAELAATDAGALPLALELLNLLAVDAPSRRAVLEQIAGLHERAYKAATAQTRPRVAADLVEAYQELIGQQIADKQFDDAAKTLKKAKSIADYYLKSNRELTHELDRQAATVAREQKIQAKLDEAQKTLQQKPDDPAANAVVGLNVLLNEDRPAEAAAHLTKSDDTALKKLSDLLTRAEPPELELADAYRNATDATDAAEFKTLLQARALRHYKSIIESDPKHPEATRIKLVISQFSESVAAEGIKPLSICARLRTAVRASKAQDTRQMGHGDDPFREVPDGALLVGFEVSYGNRNAIKSVRAIYLSERGQLMGRFCGFPSSQVRRVVAKPGYAVGAITVKSGLWIDGFSVTFMEIKGDALDPEKSYKSDWLGSRGGGAETRLAGDGSPVVGIFGKTHGSKLPDVHVWGLGLVTVPRQ
jgi:hypothetical protein